LRQRGVEAFPFRVNHQRQKLQRRTPSARGWVDPNNPKERAGDRCPKERVDLDSPDNWAGNEHLKTRSTKVSTKSGYGFSVEAVNKDVLSGDNFSSQTRLQASAWRTSSTTRQRERPSGHTEGPPQQGMGQQPAQNCSAVNILGHKANKNAFAASTRCSNGSARRSNGSARHPNGEIKAAVQATMALKPKGKPTSRPVGMPTKEQVAAPPSPSGCVQ
jgi:hypothetical protein